MNENILNFALVSSLVSYFLEVKSSANRENTMQGLEKSIVFAAKT